MSSVAIEKAKKTGKKRNFKMSSPSGSFMAYLLPKIDMVSRILTDLFVFDKIEEDEYKIRKRILYDYTEGIEEWVEKTGDFLAEKKSGKKLHYKGFIKKEKQMFLNTQVGMDAFQTFVKCDIMHRAFLQAMRCNMITETEYKAGEKVLREILFNFRDEIDGLKDFTWKLRKSNSQKF